MGKRDPDTQEWNTMVLPELQNRGVISVVLGDYHYGALLEVESCSLGWVQIPAIEVPTKVRFDHGLKQRREPFVFGVAAAGWHMGALVIDLGEVRMCL